MCQHKPALFHWTIEAATFFKELASGRWLNGLVKLRCLAIEGTSGLLGDMNLNVTAGNPSEESNGDPHKGSTGQTSPKSPPAVKSIGCVKFGTGLHAVDGGEQQMAIASAVAGAMNDSGDILVLGLADSCGLATQNLDLSERRAESVANTLLEKLTGRTIHVFGLGEGVGPFGDKLCDSQKHRTARMFLLPPDGAPD